jgi:GNAT superfamily N-acetyltransferase
MILPYKEEDFQQLLELTNLAAQIYKDKIPDILWHDPFLPADYLADEIARGVLFYKYMQQRKMIGVMGVHNFDDAAIIRHTYIHPDFQRQGIGSKLISMHLEKSKKPMLVGCLNAMHWAISFYQRHGFTLVNDDLRDQLRAKYWNYSEEHVKNSVVLVDGLWQKCYGKTELINS